MTSQTRIPQPDEGTSAGSDAPLRIAAAFALIIVALSLTLALTGTIRTSLVLAPVALIAGVALVALAIVRFETFILTLLVIRSSLDLAKSTTAGSSVSDPASIVALLMIGASIGWLIIQGPARPTRPLSPLSFGLVLFTMAVGVSIIGSAQLGVSAGTFLRILSGALMFFVVDRLLSQGMPLRRLIVALFLSTIIPVLLPVIGALSGHDFTRTKDGVQALTSTFVLSNNFAHFLVPFLIIGLALVSQIRPPARWALVIFLVIGLVELVSTNTRGAWAALIIGAATVGLARHKALLLVLVVGTVLAIALVPTVNQRLANLSPDPDRPRTESSWTWRIEHWGTIIPLASENPITGIGTGMTARVTIDHKEPHNDYVRAYVETGLLGLGAYLWFVGSFLWVAHRSRKRARGGFEASLTLGIFAYAVAFAISSVAENLITGVAWLWYAMPLAAIVNWIACRPSLPIGIGASDAAPSRRETTAEHGSNEGRDGTAVVVSQR